MEERARLITKTIDDAPHSVRAGCRRSTAVSSSSTSRRCAPSSCAGARGLRFERQVPSPHKAERVAMEEVRRGLVYYDVPRPEAARRGRTSMSVTRFRSPIGAAQGLALEHGVRPGAVHRLLRLRSGSRRPSGRPAGRASVVKSLDERITHQPMDYLPPNAPRGPADQLKSPELVEAAARKYE